MPVTALVPELGAAFVLGLLTPLGAVCVLPLYPGFLAYLAGELSEKEQTRKHTIFLFGLVISVGVVLFMFFFGLIFTTVLQVSLTNIVGIASPIAFVVLIVISILLLLNIDIGRFLPRARTRVTSSPWASAFLYGLFFGAIVIPCNPAFIAVLFTTTTTGAGFAFNIARFIFFGIGIAFPLLVIAAISSVRTDTIINFLTKNKKTINRVAGGVMLGISLYYLIFVFRVFDRFIS